MARKFAYINETEEIELSFSRWSNDFKVLAEIVGGYHEKSVIGRYMLVANIYADGVQIYAHRIAKSGVRPLKFYISSHGSEVYIKIGKLDGEGANLLNRLIKAFNL